MIEETRASPFGAPISVKKTASMGKSEAAAGLVLAAIAWSQTATTRFPHRGDLYQREPPIKKPKTKAVIKKEIVKKQKRRARR